MSALANKTELKKSDVSPIARNYLTNIRVAALAAIVLIAAGLASFFALPRTLNPGVDIPIVFISTALPGANPEDVESLVTIPLEDAARSVSGIDVAASTSSESSSTITLQFFSDVDADRAKQDVQSAIDTVTDLPEDATTPVVAKLDFEDQPIWSFALISDTEASLQNFAERFKERLENLPKIDRVTLRGWEEREISVIIRPETLQTFGISQQLLTATIRASVNAQPAGGINAGDSEFSLSIDPNATTIEALRNTIITAGGNTHRLGEIADVAERPVPGASGAYHIEDETLRSSVTFDIYKSSSERIDESYEEAQKLVNATMEQENGNFRIATITSTADDMNEQFSSLLRNFAITIGLVFLVLLTFFGLRQAIVASFTIPLTFMGALVVMNATGMTINFLSLFSLLLSLGLLVDVTIVILSAIASYWRTGRFTPEEAGLLTWRDYSATLFTTTITTVWAFSPLLLATGIIGEFIKPIPIVVSSTLLSSLVVGLFLVLPFMMALLRPRIPRRVKIFFALVFAILIFTATFFAFGSILGNPLLQLLAALLTAALFWTLWKTLRKIRHSKKSTPSLQPTTYNLQASFSSGFLRLDSLADRYKTVICGILASPKARKKTVAIVTIAFIFAVSLVASGLVRNEFFPKENTDVLYVQLELPQGTRGDVTEERALDLAREFSGEPAIEEMHIQIGTGFSADSGIVSSGNHTALITLNLFDEDDRDESSITLAEQFREMFAAYPRGDVSVYELSGGPPAGADVAITLTGDNSETLDQLAENVITHLETMPGTTNIEKSITPGAPKITFIPDEDLLAEHGKSSRDIATVLRTFANGSTLADDIALEDTQEKRDIVLRFDEASAEADTLSTLAFFGETTPIASYGTFELRANPPRITREDGKRSISIFAGVSEGYSVSEIGAGLERFAETELALPEGYDWKTGGVNEENAKSINSILQAMLLAGLLIIGTLVIRLGSYRKALIVMLVIPLALIGVFTVFALTGTPLSFPALIGVLALFGIVVNNSIILVDKINQNLAVGLDQRSAVAEASASRLEPIFLSSLTTIIGLTPITLSDPLWQGLGGAIIAGLFFSGTVMLFFIPVVYMMWFRESK